MAKNKFIFDDNYDNFDDFKDDDSFFLTPKPRAKNVNNDFAQDDKDSAFGLSRGSNTRDGNNFSNPKSNPRVNPEDSFLGSNSNRSNRQFDDEDFIGLGSNKGEKNSFNNPDNNRQNNRNNNLSSNNPFYDDSDFPKASSNRAKFNPNEDRYDNRQSNRYSNQIDDDFDMPTIRKRSAPTEQPQAKNLRSPAKFYNGKDEDDYNDEADKEDLYADEDDASFSRDELFSDEAITKEYFKTDKKAKYSQTLIAGFFWFAMFGSSFASLFFIFQTQYYLYYDEQEPIVLEENKLMIDTRNVFNNDNQLSFNQEIQNNAKDENANSNVNEDDGKLSTKLPKSQDDNIDYNPLDPNIEGDDKNRENPFKFSKDDIKKEVAKANNNLTDNRLPNQANIKADSGSMNALIKKQQAKPVVKETKEPETPKLNADIVWLVNIYSSETKDLLEAKLKNLQANYPVLDDSYVFYFTEYKTIQNQVKYRISIAKVSSKYYTNSLDATRLCETLKKSKVDCFIGTVSKKNIATN